MDEAKYIADINACLEPSIPDGLKSLDQRRDLSVAISLKRIADALAGVGSDGLLDMLHNRILDTAYHAGTHFEAGKRIA